MKVLYVSSGSDYAACTFEDDKVFADLPVLWERVMAKDGEIADFVLGDEDATEVDLEAYEFGEVDPNFIKFIRDTIQDYDDSKHSNFYIID